MLRTIRALHTCVWIGTLDTSDRGRDSVSGSRWNAITKYPGFNNVRKVISLITVNYNNEAKLDIEENIL